MSYLKKQLISKEDFVDGNQLVATPIESVQENTFIEKCLENINELPDSIDVKHVLKIKEAVENGTYNFDEKIPLAVDGLINESTSESAISISLNDH